ncbi:MAG: PEP-CTERM sorting domain-containing protein [Acidobacteria bacterium]|nr:PEP-CTERM sorting domain-containing protein [Acidobacteriota bacterium]
MRNFALILAGLFTSAHLAASTVTIYGDRADTQVHKFGIHGGDPGQNQGQNGLNGGFDYSMIFVFQLPVVGLNQIITNAEFSPYVLSSGLINPTDLYGIAYRALPTVLASDWFTGTGDPNNTLIQSSFLTQNTVTADRAVTSPSGNAALTSFLNAQYAAGADDGDSVFLRLSTNATTLVNGSVNFYYTADVAPFLAAATGLSLDFFQEQFSPILNVTIEDRPQDTSVPEPASVAGVGLGLGLLILLRSRRQRPIAELRLQRAVEQDILPLGSA